MTSSLNGGSWKTNIETLTAGLDLTPEQMRFVMREILSGYADLESIKSFLLALKAKGETAAEVGALVAEMYSHAAPSIS